MKRVTVSLDMETNRRFECIENSLSEICDHLRRIAFALEGVETYTESIRTNMGAQSAG